MKLFTYFLLCFALINISAQENADKSEKLLQASNQLAIEFLITSSDKETGLWINPHIYNHMVWEKTGKMIEVDEPIREIVGYEDAWAWVDRPSPADPYRKVYEKYKRPIYKVTGTRKVKVEESKPTKEKSSISYCQKRYIEAMNALGAYTVLELGVESAISEKMYKYFEWQDGLKAYGLSDNTIELSLQILMMMKSKFRNNSDLALQGLHKLLEGQINNGPGKGLWGYYSVNWEFDGNLDKQIAALEAKIELLNIPVLKDGKKTTPEIDKKIEIKVELDRGIQLLRLKKADISRDFFQGRKWYENRKIEVFNQPIPTYLFWPMTEFDPREKGLGCLVSTQVALYAINEAQKLGYFSDERMKKYKAQTIMQLPKSKSVIQMPSFPNLKTVLNDALAYFQKSQDKNGSWVKLEEDCKVIHPYPDMLKMKNTFHDNNTKRDIKKHEVKRPPASDSATVSAMHSLSLLAQLLGKNEFKTRYEKMITPGLAEYNKIIEKIFADEKLNEWDPITLYPYEFIVTLPDVQDSFGGTFIANPEGVNNLTSFIIKIQNETGNFNKEHHAKYNSPFQPHPFFPITIQDMWAEKDYNNGYWEHGQISVPMISTALSLLTLKKLTLDKLKFDANWTTAIEVFTNLRLELFGIKSDILLKPAVEEKKPDDATKKPEEGEAKPQNPPAKKADGGEGEKK